MASKKIERIDVEQRLFDGVARFVTFPGVDTSKFDKTTTLADVLKDAVDNGRIIEGSPSWEGDEASIEVLKSTEGGVIRSKTTYATFGYSFRVPHSAQTAKVAGAKFHKVESIGEDFEAEANAEIIGLNARDLVKHCPCGIFNETRRELALFPKGAVAYSPTTDDDGLQEYAIKVQAEDISTKHLSTMMFIPLADDPFADEDDEESPKVGD